MCMHVVVDDVTGSPITLITNTIIDSVISWPLAATIDYIPTCFARTLEYEH